MKIFNKKVKYVHDELLHNMTAPRIVAPIVLASLSSAAPSLSIKSVVDFGCGLGTWLKAFKENGVEEVLGLDGKWYNPSLLFKYIDEKEFRCVDLEKPIKLDKAYDLVVSLEVIEHISEKAAGTFVQSLVDAGKVILFSAAVPGQGGFNHVNEQWPSYWIEKFQKHGYSFYDVIRSAIWDNTSVDVPYRQNIFIAAHKSVKINNLAWGGKIYDIVHPHFLFLYSKMVDEGRIGVRAALPMFWKFLKFTFRKKVLRVRYDDTKYKIKP